MTEKEIINSLPVIDILPYLELLMVYGKSLKDITILERIIAVCKILDKRFSQTDTSPFIHVVVKLLHISALDGIYFVNESIDCLRQITSRIETILSEGLLKDFKAAEDELYIGLTSRLIKLIRNTGIGLDSDLENRTIKSIETCLGFLNDNQNTFISFADRMIQIHRVSEFGDTLAYLYLWRGDKNRALLTIHKTRSIWLNFVDQKNRDAENMNERKVAQESRLRWRATSENLEDFVAANFFDLDM